MDTQPIANVSNQETLQNLVWDQDVAGSNPVAPTTSKQLQTKGLCEQSTGTNPADSEGGRTDSAQNEPTSEAEERNLRFPKKITYRKAEATIYGRKQGYQFYRVAGYVDGKRRMSSHRTYSEAKAAALALAKDIAAGSKVAALSPGQAADAILALERLDRLFRDTGKRVSLADGIDAYCAAIAKLGKHQLSEAVDSFLATAGSVQEISLADAIDQFIDGRAHKTVAQPGRRPQLSAGYHYNVSMWAREFSRSLPGHNLADLKHELIDVYMAQFSDLSPKSRNERRNVIRMFIKWAEKRSYLARDNRLLEAEGMTREESDPETIEIYSADELQRILSRASLAPAPAAEGEKREADYRPMVPVLAMISLGGVRRQEAARLTWEDVWHIDGHIEISVAKSKTRRRRLVTMQESLAAWLQPYRKCTGPVWSQCLDKFNTDFGNLLGELKIKPRRNGLRHGFVSAHYALHADEGLTAKESGNSPQVVHANYKSLITKAQAEKWLSVKPQQPAANILSLPTSATA